MSNGTQRQNINDPQYMALRIMQSLREPGTATAIVTLLKVRDGYVSALADDLDIFPPEVLEQFESQFIEAALEFCEKIIPTEQDAPHG